MLLRSISSPTVFRRSLYRSQFLALCPVPQMMMCFSSPLPVFVQLGVFRLVCLLTADLTVGNVLPLGKVPEGTVVCSVEEKAGDRGALARTSGTFATVVGKEGLYCSSLLFLAVFVVFLLLHFSRNLSCALSLLRLSPLVHYGVPYCLII